jgi:hypothetical protein
MGKSNDSFSSHSGHTAGASYSPSFGDDTTPAPPGGAPVVTAPPAAAPVVPPPAPGTPAPTLTQAVAKAQGLAAANAVVASNPNAIHAAIIAGTAPGVLGAAATGAGVGMLMGGPPGAAIGAGIGWLTERYQIAGGPIGKSWAWLKTKFVKPAAPPVPPAST